MLVLKSLPKLLVGTPLLQIWSKLYAICIIEHVEFITCGKCIFTQDGYLWDYCNWCKAHS